MGRSKENNLPSVRIENRGALTKVYVDGEELHGVKSIEFLHDKTVKSFPILKIELLAESISIDTNMVFELPEFYHPFYVASDKLIEAGILTNDQFNELLEKGLL